MTNTPKKIWVLPLWGTEYPQDCRVTYEKELFENDSQEYIRKDISDARIEHLRNVGQDYIDTLKAKNEHLEDEKDYLQAELSMAIKTAFHRGAVEWTKLNYPKMYKSLKENN